MARLSDEEKARRVSVRRCKAAVEAEERAIRIENRRRAWREKGMYLTYAEVVAGVPCRGCGLLVVDGLGSWPPVLKLTDAERRGYEAADAEFRRRHAGCDAIRWSIQGSRERHCGCCCPPPPSSDEQLHRVAELFRSFGRPDPAELDTWRLILTCDHVVDVTQHKTAAGPSTTARCEQCGQTRGVVEAEKLPCTDVRRAAEERRLAAAIVDARQLIDRYERQAASARRRAQALEQDLQTLRG